MSTIERIAARLGRSDEVPNKALARDLAARNDAAGIAEIAAHLWDRDAATRSDCIKVLYEAAELNPALVAPHAAAFVRLLGDKQNRMVWGGMSALAEIAPVAGDALSPHVAEIRAAMARGSVIAVDAGVKTLARLAAGSPERNAALFPVLLDHLATCRAKEVPQHAESSLVAVTPANRAAFVAVLERRLPELTPAQAARVKRVVKSAAAGAAPG
jgi:hypothetical protein